MTKSYLHFIPAATFLFIPSTFVITYFLSKYEHHVYPNLLNFSQTVAVPPESCLFGMMLNLTAFMMLFTVYIRHKQVVEVVRAKGGEESSPRAFVVNRVATITGLVACGSLDVIANFQDISITTWIHRIAASLCLLSSGLYLVQQALLTSWMVPEMHGIWLMYVRWLLGGVALIAALTESVSTTTSVTLLAVKGNLSDIMPTTATNRTSHWDPNMPGYSWHRLSSMLQWIIFSILGAYVLTFYWDFKKISINEPELEIEEDPVPDPVLPMKFHRSTSSLDSI